MIKEIKKRKGELQMKELLDFIESEIKTEFDPLLERCLNDVVVKKAQIQTMKNFIKEMDALRAYVPETIHSDIEDIQKDIEKSKKKIKIDLKNLLNEVSDDEVEKLVKMTKFATRNPISGAAFLTRNTQHKVGDRVKEETVEELVKLMPEEIAERVKNSKNNQVQRFVNLFKPKNVSSGVSKWIEENIENDVFKQRLKSHYEEMKENIYTEDILEDIAMNWVDLAIAGQTPSEENRKVAKEKLEDLINLFKEDQEITIL